MLSVSTSGSGGGGGGSKGFFSASDLGGLTTQQLVDRDNKCMEIHSLMEQLV